MSCGAYSILSHAIQGFVQEGDEVRLFFNLPPLNLKARHLSGSAFCWVRYVGSPAQSNGSDCFLCFRLVVKFASAAH